MAIIRSYCRESICNPISYVLVLDALMGSAAIIQHFIAWESLKLWRKLKSNSQPSMPPFPVANVLPVHDSGSHNSYVILDLLEVGIESATRHTSTGTIWLFRLHVASLSGNVRFEPAGTYCNSVLVELYTCFSGVNEAHLSSKEPRSLSTCSAELATVWNIMTGLDGWRTKCSENYSEGKAFTTRE